MVLVWIERFLGWGAKEQHVSARGKVDRVSVMDKWPDGTSEWFDLRVLCWWLIAHSVARTQRDGRHSFNCVAEGTPSHKQKADLNFHDGKSRPFPRFPSWRWFTALEVPE